MKRIEQHKKMFIRALKEIHGLEIDEAVEKTIDEYTDLMINHGSECYHTFIDRKVL